MKEYSEQRCKNIVYSSLISMYCIPMFLFVPDIRFGIFHHFPVKETPTTFMVEIVWVTLDDLGSLPHY